ncbi:MAG: DNA recombination protein RmuC [Spirochaetales bacterium]
MINLLLAIEVTDIITLSISAVVLILVLVGFFIKGKTGDSAGIIKAQEKSFEQLIKEQAREFENIKEWFKTYSDMQKELIKSYNEKVEGTINNITVMQKNQLEVSNNRLVELRNSNEQRLDKMLQLTDNTLTKMMNNNEIKLEQMRKTVDEKLNESLEKRFNQSFEVMQKQFDQVTEQLGQMKVVANSVGDLQKVLTNVKSRGTFGEVQLANLLEQMLAPNQYSEQTQVNGNNNRGGADFVINLPGKDNENILLPIDSKFPMEDYLRLLDVYDSGTKEEIKKQQELIVKTVKKQAKSISEKYINPPLTTNFAIMYIAVEGLYSELLRNAGLVEELQREYRIIISGPTTFSAILSSLQMGFKTLSIQKHSTEIWNALTGFRKEFGIFTDLLVKTQKQVTDASNTIESATKKTKTIEKTLNRVAEIAAPEEGNLLKSIDPNVDDGTDE